MRAVLIEWLDSAGAHRGPWLAEDEVVRAVQCTSVGFLVEKNKREVIIAQSTHDGGQRGNVYAIPTRAIVKMRRLK